MRCANGISTVILCAAAALASSGAGVAQTASSGGASSGQLAFNNHCRTCHTVKEGDNRLGPSLHGIVGKKAGSNPDYAAYSQAMRTAGVVWDEKTLDRFLADPEGVVPNNNMKPFKAVPDAKVREAIIDYLESPG